MLASAWTHYLARSTSIGSPCHVCEPEHDFAPLIPCFSFPVRAFDRGDTCGGIITSSRSHLRPGSLWCQRQLWRSWSPIPTS